MRPLFAPRRRADRDGTSGKRPGSLSSLSPPDDCSWVYLYMGCGHFPRTYSLLTLNPVSQIEPYYVAPRKRSSPRSRRIEPPLWDALEQDVGSCIVAFLGWGTHGGHDKNAKSLRLLLFLPVHSSLGFAAVSRQLSRGPPGCRRFHVPWSWLRAYVFANYAEGAGRILHCGLRAAADRSPPAATSPAVLLAATEKACRVCGAPTRPNPSREEQVGAPPGSRTCRICLCNPRFKHIFQATTAGVRQGLNLSDREWRRWSATIRSCVGTWRDGRFGSTLYPYKRTRACVARLRRLHKQTLAVRAS